MQNRFPEGLPPLDPVDDMGIKDHGLTECVRVCCTGCHLQLINIAESCVDCHHSTLRALMLSAQQ